jgi:hypothetical protein
MTEEKLFNATLAFNDGINDVIDIYENEKLPVIMKRLEWILINFGIDDIIITPINFK